MKLRRCTKCILPETVPFIDFDEDGVCSYCREYLPIKSGSLEDLDRLVTPYRSNKNDCIVSFSGGRDSSYALYYVKVVLGLNPIAFSYDWGMGTDLSEINMPRMCSKLGVELVVAKADINKKMQYLKSNLEAWMKKPSLGTVPLFMAGDKQYFYYANKLRKLTGLDLVIMGMNPLEKTDFKTGFCGIKPKAGAHYRLSQPDTIGLMVYYGRSYLANPRYINRSLWDTMFAFLSYYCIPHDYLNLYQYVDWNEDHINSVLVNEYEWETSKVYPSTWRIGDGTAPLYNYIFHMVAGFTENDALRSNQIREGHLTRGKALALVEKENLPRIGEIENYCGIVGVDSDKLLRVIDSMPKLYVEETHEQV